MRSFLEYDEVRCSGHDCFRKRFFPAQAAEPDVVTQQP
jgi:hypothetical protein